MDRTEKKAAHTSSRKRLEQLKDIRRNRDRITNETLLMKMVYGAIASLVVFIAAVNLLHFVYIKYYFSDPGSFRLATIVIIVACAAWYYFRVPSFMDNYRVWKERRNSSEL